MLKHLFDHSRDQYYGYPLAPIELIEYGDFQCKQCASAYPEIRMLQEKMGNRLKFVFRHFPLSPTRPLSLDAAIAAEAASRQEKLKFWYMHNMIFENQKCLSHASLSEFAAEIELDLALFEASRTDKKLIQKVTSDFESGANSGVTTTPTFFINCHRYNGFPVFESIYKACNNALRFKSPGKYSDFK
jgi:protein-disulfide isomerase